MLLYIRFNNFYSFAEQAELSFKVGKQAAPSLYDIHLKTAQDELRLNKVAAVLGANGSGKTQLLKVIPFISWFIVSSARTLSADDEIYFEAFTTKENQSSNFEVGFTLKNEQGIDEEFRYEVTMTSKNVQREALYQKTSRSFSYIFERTHQDELKNYKHRSFLAPALADDVNDNVSLLAYAFLLDNPIAVRVIQFFSQMTFNLHTAGRRESSDADLYRMAELFSKRASLKQQAEQLLCQFDTGISKINFAPVIMVDENKKQKEVLMPMGVHQHDDQAIEFLFTDESNGTRSAFILLGMILPVLESGGMAIIDEIDNDLHPHLLPHLIDLFKFEHTNPHQAQLIFSCHTPEVLNILKKHQIYLVQKENQESEAWRLDEVVGVRADDNLYAKYMAGAFDAVPNV